MLRSGAPQSRLGDKSPAPDTPAGRGFLFRRNVRGTLRCVRGTNLSAVIARSACDEAIQSFRARDFGLLRFARNDVERERNSFSP